MSVSLERPELQNFITTWSNKPKGQVVEELASYSLETKRIPDPYHFEVDKDGDLFSSNAGAKIKNIISRSNYIGWVEGQAFDAIEDYTKTHDEGTLMWVSSPLKGIYPNLKVIVSEIEKKGSSKSLFNRAMIFDFNKDQAQRFVQALAEFSENYPLRASLEDLRGTPLVLNSEELSWVSVLEKLINDEAQWEYIRTGEDIKAKTEARLQAMLVYQGLFNNSLYPEDAKERIIMMLGDKSSSCPVRFESTAFQVFSDNSLSLGTVNLSGSDQYGSLEFDCPKCKRQNKRPRGKLIPNCQYTDCGANVRC